MEIITAISAGKSLIEIGAIISPLVEKARKSPDVVIRALYYLEAVQASVTALGLERQRIITHVRKCDVGDKDQVEALWTRLHVYLFEDNISRNLQASAKGLVECYEKIGKDVDSTWWRSNDDKKITVRTFSATLRELGSILESLNNNFYPGGSGMGVQTLMPIYNLVDDIHQNNKLHDNEELAELALEALSDSSQRDWIQHTGRIETLIAKLQLSFSVKANQYVSGAG